MRQPAKATWPIRNKALMRGESEVVFFGVFAPMSARSGLWDLDRQPADAGWPMRLGRCLERAAALQQSTHLNCKSEAFGIWKRTPVASC